MDDLKELTEAIYNLNPAILLSVAGGIALLFVAFVFYDSKRHNRRPRRPGEVHSSRTFANPFRNLRQLYRSANSEMSRRRRHKARERDREKY